MLNGNVTAVIFDVPTGKTPVPNGRLYALLLDGRTVNFINSDDSIPLNKVAKKIIVKNTTCTDETHKNLSIDYALFNDSDYCLQTAVDLADKLYKFSVEIEESESELYEIADGVNTHEFYIYKGKMIELTEENREEMSGLLTNILVDNKSLDELKDIDGDIIVKVENTPKPFNLKINKVDQFGNKLGAGYKFKITIDNCLTEKNGNKNYYEGITNSEGIIEINNIYTESLESEITFEEIAQPEGTIYKMIPTTKVKINRGTNTTVTKDNLKITIKDNIKVEVKIEEPFELNLNVLKKGSGGSNLAGAVFKIKIKEKNTENYLIDETTYTTNSNGEIEINDIDLTKCANLRNGLLIEMEETQAPYGYFLPENTKTVVGLNVKNNQYVVNSSSIATGGEAKVNGSTLILIINNVKKLPDINLLKVDRENNVVPEVEFEFTIQGVKAIKVDNTKYNSSENKIDVTLTTNRFGYINITEIEPIKTEGINEVKIIINEVKTKSGLKLLTNPITIEYNFDVSSGKIKQKSSNTTENDDNVSVEINDDGIEINAINDLIIEKLSILKMSSQDPDTKLNNAKFKIELNNVKSVEDKKDSDNDGKITIEGDKIITDTNGTLELKDLVIKDISKDVVIKITETSAPVGYKKLEGAITLKLKRKGDGYEYAYTEKDSTITNKEFEAGNITVTNHEIELDIKNIPLINIGGIVWEDAPTGEKRVEGPNDKKDNEENGIPEIEIKIFDEEGNAVTEDAYGRKLMTTTANNGSDTYNNEGVVTGHDHHTYQLNGILNNNLTYDLYNGGTENITLSNGEYIFPNLEKGKYYVEFYYDGINYKTVDCSENLYTSNKESKVTEEIRDDFNARFETISQGQSNDGTVLNYTYDSTKETSQLNVGIQGKNLANNESDFQMKAKSSKYLQSGDTNWKTVWNEDGTINRNHYALDVNCGLTEKFFDLALGTDVKSALVTINGKEYPYTYAQIMNGELEDLKLDELTQKNSSETNGTGYSLYIYRSDYNFRIEDYKTDVSKKIENKVNEEDNNKTNYDVLEELEVYVTYSIFLKNHSKQPGTVEKFEYYYDTKYISPTIAEMDDYDYAIDEANKKITFTHKGNSTLNESVEYSKKIEVTFKVNKDSNGYVLKGEFSNAGEIIEYSTPDGGFIDYDSAPGNTEFVKDEQKTIKEYDEDDCDQAPGLNININIDSPRKITGTVFEDLDKNGQNDDYKPVNDVIVQLIELKTISGEYCEYIWQETKSGSNIVKITDKNGYTGRDYTSEASEAGTYQFKEFIPGNYIIRFIYGDGRTYDITPNVQKYNGQDYKSTIDNSYKEEWYDQANYTENSSVARDNEARRLEVMAYSTTIDKDIGKAIDQKTNDMLRQTWMCAETSKVDVPVEGNNTSYANMNFGLALRPKTTITFEKHITRLKITPQGTGSQPIVDAKVVDGKIQGITAGLAPMEATREDRGFWKVETDIEELAQGATVELEYTYTINNESEEDYLSNTLINEYKLKPEEYANYLFNIVDKNQGKLKDRVKGKTNTYGTYLGEYYYTGTKSSTDSEVLSTVNVIEDNLNNNLKLVEETDMAFKKFNTNAETKYVYDEDGTLKTENIETVIRNTTKTEALAKGQEDSTKTAKLTTTLSSSSKEISYPAYIGEIVEYTNAAGRKDMDAIPGNLKYVHSYDSRKTIAIFNEHDENWAETLIVSKPTGENKQAPMQIVIIAISSIAVIGVGIILIKKFVLK